jgi:hypothetical protein
VKRTVIALFIAVTGSIAAGVVTHAFNDKGAIWHNGHLLCIDWHGWTQHQLHGDPPGDPLICDRP